MGLELKFIDYTYSATISTGTAGAEADPTAPASSISVMTQGDGESARDGRRVILKSYEVRGVVKRDAQADAADPQGVSVVRLLLVQDHQTNGVQLDSEKVLVDSAGLDVNSMINLQYQQRFRIIKDVTVTMRTPVAFTDGASTGAVSQVMQPFHWAGNLNIPVNMGTGATADIANIVDESLHIIAISSNAGHTLDYTSRVRFMG